jgi:hypothetical protein
MSCKKVYFGSLEYASLQQCSGFTAFLKSGVRDDYLISFSFSRLRKRPNCGQIPSPTLKKKNSSEPALTAGMEDGKKSTIKSEGRIFDLPSERE